MTNLEYPIPLQSQKHMLEPRFTRKHQFWFWFVSFLMLGILFLPWTQNIKSRGKVTTLYQEQRAQEIHSPIPGRIARWYAKEGDYLKKGDTILQLSEIKEDYLDPNLIERTKEQVNAKEEVILSYENKIGSYGNQVNALREALPIKLKQIEIKISQVNFKLKAEEAELKAAENEVKLLRDQYERQQKMLDEGLSSQTQLQQRLIAYQNILAKKQGVENKLMQSKQDIGNLQLEKNQIIQEYTEKINKAESERFQSEGEIAKTKSELAKLRNQVASYVVRNGFYYILATQNGQLVKALRGGLGEVIKEAEYIATIIPDDQQFAVEIFVRPVDMPLIHTGQSVRFIFDGFPTVVFSGWPKYSYGTFAGTIYSYENNIHDNGMFRVLVIPDNRVKPWPKQLKTGTGVQAIALLKDVPLGYELWRSVNGFPPDFYQPNDKKPNEKKK
ncbi:MAG: HlyD family efflux transporter periplasmic adaptor subunit [Chitinophagaceae bacterium]|nr:HlyD family efflux transporter periplasmic adaptor subunit [Chitinophagaceae bacterium]